MIARILRAGHRCRRRSGGFTLVELLVTIAIIAIVTSFILSALAMAQEAARHSKTKGLVAQLHNKVMQQWETYRTRRLPIDTTGLSPQVVADRRLLALRELMRMEMPDRWSDVTDAPVNLASRPTVSRAYLRQHASNSPSAQDQGAECLYLMLSMMRDDEALELIEKHSGDTDSDGIPEIIDAWGNPIRFIRWPAGFTPANSADTALQTGDAANDHDPFDPLRRDSTAYALVPLIYSAGPDAVYDIAGDIEEPPGSGNYLRYAAIGHNPYYTASSGQQVGEPVDLNTDGLQHLDNVHNHMMGLTTR